MIQEIAHWIDEHIQIPGLPVWASIIIIALAMAAMSLVITAIALIFIPADYFTQAAANRPPYYHHPIIHWTVRILRNILGWFLIILGVLLCFMPGQGMLTILLGIMLAEFPGKSRLELKLIRMERVRLAVDKLRGKYGRPPLIIDE